LSQVSQYPISNIDISGVNIIVYYVGYVVQKFFNLGNSAVLLVSMGFGIINFTFALPAFYTIDTFGRRSLLLITFPFLAICQLLTAIALTGHQGQSHWIAKFPSLGIVAMYLFGVFYSPGEGPVPFVYAAESMPLYIRDVGMGLVTSVNWFFNWLIAFTAPWFFRLFKPYGAFLWYTVWCVLLWFMIFL
jgi:MFS family permease